MNRKLFTVSRTCSAVLLGLVMLGIAVWQTSAAHPAVHPSGTAFGVTVAPNSVTATTGNGFTYQGVLTVGGVPANGTYDFRFSLWNAAFGGTLVGSAVTFSNQPVNNGVFTQVLDFGSGRFQGDARWLQIDVQQNGSGYVLLPPRQQIAATPYALGLVPGVTIVSLLNTALLTIDNTGNGRGLYSRSSGSDGVYGETAATGASGVAGISTGSGDGVYGNSIGAEGVAGLSTNGDGVYGQTAANNKSGVLGFNSGSGTGVYGNSVNGTGVYGQSTSNDGVTGIASSNTKSGVYGTNTTNGQGVYGNSTGGDGLHGVSTSGNGVYGISTNGNGIVGQSSTSNKSGIYGNNLGNGDAVSGYSSSGVGVHGISDSNTGVYGSSISGQAGFFQGNVQITGNISKGGGSFKIDDPLDPANKYLSHSFVESPDMKNIYDGVVVLDTSGSAWVTMPQWFQVLNRDFRYQLTTIGGYAPVYIGQELQNNRFQIAGGTAGLKVSWMITGIRQDPYANAYRIPIEQDKPADERGTYLHPELYGQPESKRFTPSVAPQPTTTP